MDERHEALARRFKEGLEAIYGPRLRGVYACQDDDEEAEALETIVVLDDFEWAWDENEHAGALAAKLVLESGIAVGVTLLKQAEWAAGSGEATPALHRVA